MLNHIETFVDYCNAMNILSKDAYLYEDKEDERSKIELKNILNYIQDLKDMYPVFEKERVDKLVKFHMKFD